MNQQERAQQQSSASGLAVRHGAMHHQSASLATHIEGPQNSSGPLPTHPPPVGGSQINARRLWACPLYKSDPLAHYRCIEKHKLKRYADVKQHLCRCHNLSASDSTREGRVPPQGGRDEQKWYQLWDNLFQERLPPSSPYVEDGIAEPIAILRSHAERLVEANMSYLLQAVDFKVEANVVLTLGHAIQRIIFEYSLPLNEFPGQDTTVAATEPGGCSAVISAPLPLANTQPWAETVQVLQRTASSLPTYGTFHLQPRSQFNLTPQEIPPSQLFTFSPPDNSLNRDGYLTSGSREFANLQGEQFHWADDSGRIHGELGLHWGADVGGA